VIDMLSTPLGDIIILIDNKAISYNAIPVNRDKTCMDIHGRYKIVIDFIPDGQEHQIKCLIDGYENIDDDFVETGDNLELKSFVKNNIKLSIGMEGDSGYFSDGTRISDYYDYDNDYFDNGVSYQILKNTQTNKYVFGIAWIVDQRPDNEVQTWYGADPSIM
jgi:hypothetical protein